MKNKFFFKGMLALGAALCLGSFTAQAYKVNRIPVESRGSTAKTDVYTMYEVTADDIINAGEWHEQDHQGYLRRASNNVTYLLDIMHRSHNAELYIEKVSDYRIKVHGMFGGLATVTFDITDAVGYNGYTVSRLKMVTNNTYNGNNMYVARDTEGNTGFNVRQVQVYPSAKDNSGHWNVNNVYSDPICWDEVEDMLIIDFFSSDYNNSNGAITLQKFLGTESAGKREYVDFLTLQSYKSSCTIEDTQVVRGGTHDRTFRGEFEWDAKGSNTFQMSSLGGCYARVTPEIVYSLGGVSFSQGAMYSNSDYLAGTYDLDNMTAQIKKQILTLDCAGLPFDTRTQGFANMYQFSTCKVDNNGNYAGDVINGILLPRDEDVNHKGNNSWVTHGGDRTTWTNIDIELTDNWSAYNTTSSSTDSEIGYFTKTIIRPDKKKEVEVTHHVELLEAAMSHDKDYDYIWVKNEKGEDVKKGYFKVSAIVHPIKNHRYVGGYNVYYEEGTVSSWSDVDNNNRKQLDNSTLTRNSDGTYTYTGRYFPKGEEIMENQKLTAEITLYVETVYAGAATASESKTAVADLTPTHHALTPLRSDITTGVNELYKESVAIESTENGVIANGEFTGEVEVYSANGMLVAKGVANEEIALDGNGIFIVRAGGKTAKIVK